MGESLVGKLSGYFNEIDDICDKREFSNELEVTAKAILSAAFIDTATEDGAEIRVKSNTKGITLEIEVGEAKAQVKILASGKVKAKALVAGETLSNDCDTFDEYFLGEK